MKNNFSLSLFAIILACFAPNQTRALLSLPAQIPAPSVSTDKESTRRQQATDLAIRYFKNLVDKDIIGAEHLSRLIASEKIFNPLSREETTASDKHFTYSKQLDTLLARDKKGLIDFDAVKAWAKIKLAALEGNNRDREEAHENTRDVHRAIHFVPLPAGRYISAIDHEEFEIPKGIEIQDAPVTQWQWVQVMGENPSIFKDGMDAEEFLVNGKKIKLLSDYPVENVSHNDVQEFIKKLSEKDPEYNYNLPSVDEYQALLQTVLGTNWLHDQLH